MSNKMYETNDIDMIQTRTKMHREKVPKIAYCGSIER